jgi:hypothetical protein
MDIVSAIGPGSTQLPNNTLEGYQPVSRNGEVTQNAFIDAFQWNMITNKENPTTTGIPTELTAEDKPAFHEWASVTPGIICVFAKDRTNNYRQHAAAETACPVIACAQLLNNEREIYYSFAGIARSASVRTYDDIAHGATRDEFFTLHIGGPVTLLNNGNNHISTGDPVEWTFLDDSDRGRNKRQRAGPRRIQVRKAEGSHARVFGRALSFAKRGEPLDVLVGCASM